MTCAGPHPTAEACWLLQEYIVSIQLTCEKRLVVQTITNEIETWIKIKQNYRSAPFVFDKVRLRKAWIQVHKSVSDSITSRWDGILTSHCTSESDTASSATATTRAQSNTEATTQTTAQHLNIKRYIFYESLPQAAGCRLCLRLGTCGSRGCVTSSRPCLSPSLGTRAHSQLYSVSHKYSHAIPRDIF